MHIYYDIDSQSGLFLSTDHRSILLRRRSGEQFSRPVLLATDYETGLHCTVYDHIIYYAYVSTPGTILLKSISGLQTLYQITPVHEHHLSNPSICTIGEQLLLLYLDENNDHHTYQLKHCLPFCSQVQLPELAALPPFPSLPKIDLSYTHDTGILTIHSDSTTRYLKLSPELRITELRTAEELQTSLDRMIQERCQILSAAATLEHDNKLKTLKHEYEQSLHALQQEKDALQDQLLTLSGEISRQKEVIISASNQYSDLMKVANTYKAEALKWHSKYQKAGKS